jgi:dihydroceramide fatty acyl 2-hydroxylase
MEVMLANAPRYINSIEDFGNSAVIIQKIFVQFLTLTKWWVVPVIWLPVVYWLFAKSIMMGHTIREVVLMALFGVFVWTLIEYTLHRFLFHIETKSYW